MKTKKYRFFPALIFLIDLIIYSLFNYGGIRSPDSEIVFRTTESLALRHEFAVQEPIDWENFGLSPGLNNQRYSIFGPGESIIALPFLKIAYFLKSNKIIIDSNYIPISFNLIAKDELAGVYYIEGKKPPTMNGQYERFIVSFFNSLIGALSGLFFYFVLVRITRSQIVSLLTTFIFSFGTLTFPYSGTFFSEPLCMLFIIISFLFIIKNEIPSKSNTVVNLNYFNSGLFLGLAVTTHISAVLSIPFYFVFILGQVTNEKFDFKKLGIYVLFFTLGLIVFGTLLFYYNYSRFGNIFETGRTVPLIHYAAYSNPAIGIYGLLLSPGKGLFIYCPVVFLSFVCWRYFHKSYPHLSIAILAMILIRIFFIASRSDWHGGFCLGPRYLVIMIPFLCLPIALGLKAFLNQRRFNYFILLVGYSFICICQQIFLSIGEIFSYLHIIFRQQKTMGIDTLLHNSLYLEWKYSPAFNLLNYKVGPFLLRMLSANAYSLWLWTTICFLICYTILCRFTYKSFSGNPLRYVSDLD